MNYFKAFNEFLDLIDFRLLYSKDDNEFNLIDIAGGNLGDIESYRFTNLKEVISRLDVYIRDYIIEDVINETGAGDYKDYADLINIIKKSNKEDYLELNILILNMLIHLDEIDDFDNIDVILKSSNVEMI